MLRVVVMLDCNECGQSYYKAAVCSDPDPSFWQSFANDLTTCAGIDGWFTTTEYDNGNDTESSYVVCDQCLEAKLHTDGGDSK